MLDLSPVKLLVILVVAMLLLGPDKLPQVARQLGAAWRKLNEFRERVDREVREAIPDLPSSQDLARLARSPVALLNQLATFEPDGVDEPVPDPGAAPPTVSGAWPADPGAGATAPDSGHLGNGVEGPATAAGGPAATGHTAPSERPQTAAARVEWGALGDPSMN